MPYLERRYQILLKSTSGPIDFGEINEGGPLVSQGGEDAQEQIKSPASSGSEQQFAPTANLSHHGSPGGPVLHADKDGDMMGVLRFSSL